MRELRRVKFSAEADGRLRMLKARTGLDANIICRLGLCLSLEETGDPRSDSSGVSSQREISRYVLLGEYDGLFLALLNARHPESRGDERELAALFVRHLHRGIGLLANRVKDIASLGELVGARPTGQGREWNVEAIRSTVGSGCSGAHGGVFVEIHP